MTRAGLILFVQTFGDLANFNPHVHVLAADGAFLPAGTFVPLPAVPEELLAEGRRAVLEFLAENDAIIPDRYEHLVRTVGWYSNRARGERARALKVKELATKPPTEAEPVRAFAARAKGREGPLPLPRPPGRGSFESCARQIRCVVRRILEHRGRWAPEASERGPPVPHPRVAGERRHCSHVPRSPRHRVAVASRRPGFWPIDATSVANRRSRLAECPTHKDRKLPDRLTTTATAQTRESGEIDLPCAYRCDDPGDGLAAFKRGFANRSEPFFLCGKVLDEDAHASLSSGKETDYFPADRG